MDWQELLLDWERESHQILSLVPLESMDNPSVVEDRETPHFSAAASASRIDDVESRLGLKLPVDLRSFYLASNGWRLVGMGDMKLAAVEDIALATASPPYIWREIHEYLSGNGSFFGTSHDRLLLLSGSARKGFVLANPSIDGKWDFWFAELGSEPHNFSDFSA